MQTYRILFPFLLILLAGCSAVKFVEENPITAELLVKQGTMRYIERSDDWPAKAARVAEVARDVQDAASGDLFTLAELRGRAIDAANLEELDPADRILAMALIDSIADRVEEKADLELPTGEVDLVAFNQITAWVIEATTYYE